MNGSEIVPVWEDGVAYGSWPAPDLSQVRMLHQLFQPAQEVDGRWLSCGPTAPAPQDGRDLLASHFLRKTQDPGESERDRREFAAVANLLDWEAHDELVVLGRRYRVVRIERYCVFSGGLPEGPHAGDHPSAPVDAPPGYGTDLSRDAVTTRAATVLKDRLRDFVPGGGLMPREVTADALVRTALHRDLVLLPAGFQLVETRDAGRRWGILLDHHPSPQRAHDALLGHFEARFRTDVDWNDDTPAHVRDAYRRAHEACATDRMPTAVTVLDRTYRIARTIPIVRHGIDGPETPRDTDHDPYPPPAAQAQQAADEGQLTEHDDPDLIPPRPTPDDRRFLPGARP
ncbi:DUF5954 family protein [Allonocardiopsis opalescens]|uniref:DUF5954 family protein n=1 Tax=Allonocardiopsis opalescens TaxID=1144618 RepID=UPI0011B29F9B|nr:DUF5954 family protein [Allonocardiopsis opalescens]